MDNVHTLASKFVANTKEYDLGFYGDAPQSVRDMQSTILSKLRAKGFYIRTTSKGKVLADNNGNEWVIA